MVDPISLSNDDAASFTDFVLEYLRRHEAHEILEGIEESRQLGVDEPVYQTGVRPRSELKNVGTTRRRPPTNMELLGIVFERLHQRLIVLPAIASAIQQRLGVNQINWRVDSEFVSVDVIPTLQAEINDILPIGNDQIRTRYEQVRELIPDFLHPLTMETT
jgi:hypothetical protein